MGLLVRPILDGDQTIGIFFSWMSDVGLSGTAVFSMLYCQFKLLWDGLIVVVLNRENYPSNRSQERRGVECSHAFFWCSSVRYRHSIFILFQQKHHSSEHTLNYIIFIWVVICLHKLNPIPFCTQPEAKKKTSGPWPHQYILSDLGFLCACMLNYPVSFFWANYIFCRVDLIGLRNDKKNILHW